MKNPSSSGTRKASAEFTAQDTARQCYFGRCYAAVRCGWQQSQQGLSQYAVYI